MMQTLLEMKQTLTKGADLRTCARQHPWIAAGSAIAAGFVAGALLPKSRATAGERNPPRTDADAPAESTAHDPCGAQPGFLLTTLGTALTGIVQTLFQGFVTAAAVAAEVDPIKEEPQTAGRESHDRP